MKTSTNESVQAGILKERVELYGVDTLMDEEVIGILTGIPINHLKKSIRQYGLCELIRFISTIELSKAQRRKLELLYQFSKRLGSSKYRDKRILNSSSAAGEFFVSQMQFLSHEVFMIALLNTQNKRISLETVSEGTIN